MNKVIGMDVGDKFNVCVIFDEDGKESKAVSVHNTSTKLQNFFAQHPNAVVVMEAGTHSPWISRLLQKMGHEVCIGNPRKLRAIWDADDKSDERDARILGLMYRLEPRLLHAIKHRGEEAQADLATIKARNALVRTRANLVLHVRGAVKSFGGRIRSCSTESFADKAPEDIPPALWEALSVVIEIIRNLGEQIKEMDRQIQLLAEVRYPETKSLMQVPGVGVLTALAYVLILEDPARFDKSRRVGSYLGLTPKRDKSGECDKQLHITKAGNVMMRTLLLQSANYILGAFAPDSDLRRYGERICARGGKRARRCAKVAVARKLAVMLHSLWQNQSEYIALREQQHVA